MTMNRPPTLVFQLKEVMRLVINNTAAVLICNITAVVLCQAYALHKSTISSNDQIDFLELK